MLSDVEVKQKGDKLLEREDKKRKEIEQIKKKKAHTQKLGSLSTWDHTEKREGEVPIVIFIVITIVLV